MLPSRKQWKKWSLPSKWTFISGVAGLVALALAVRNLLPDGDDSSRMASNLQQKKELEPPQLLSQSDRALVQEPQEVPSLDQERGADFAPFTMDQVLRVFADKATTELQKEDFRKRYQGRRIQWHGIVESIRSFSERETDSQIIVIVSPVAPKDDSSSLRDFVGVVFPADTRKDLLELTEGDRVVFGGVLTFNFLKDIQIQDAVLLGFAKGPGPGPGKRD